MAAVDRELEITYGTFVVGGTSVAGAERLIDGFMKIDKSFTDLTVSFDFVISQTTEALFQDEIELVEAAFRNPFQDLTIVQGSETLLDCSPSTNTGLNTQPTIVKAEDIADTGRSRRYTVSIAADMPADNAPTVGIRDNSVNVGFTPARRRQVTISGTGTAVTGAEARARYEAVITAFCASILTALGGTYELAEEPTTESDYENKLIAFSRIFDELIFDQAPGEPDNVEIVGQSIKVTRGLVGPGDTPGMGVSRLLDLTATYEAWIDKDETTDIRDVWHNTIKVWFYDQIRETNNLGAIAVLDSSPQFDYDDNRIIASVTAVGVGTSSLLEHRETTLTADVFGKVLVPAWEGPYSKYLYQGPATRRRTTTITKRTLGGGSGTAQSQNFQRQLNTPGGQGFQFGFGGGSPGGIGSLGPIGSQNSTFGQSFGFGQVGAGGFTVTPAGAGGGGAGLSAPVPAGQLAGQGLDFVTVSLNITETPLTLGTDDRTINVVDTTTVLVEDGFQPVTNTGGGAGGSTGATVVGGRGTP